MSSVRPHHRREGTVYLAVLGTALIVSLLAISALSLQRLQNRSLTTAADIRQAQINAETAIELGLLDMKQTTNWRSARSNGTWFSARATGAGTCTLQVTDPIDSNLADDPDEPVVMLGIGYSGSAEQRVTWTVDPKNKPLDCLRSAVAAGDAISLTGSVLRASSSGLVTANTTAASSSTLYGAVQATSVSGATYSGTTTVVTASQRPAMPDWTTAFAYYKTNGTQIDINSLPTSTPNLGRNVDFDSATLGSTYWTGTATGIPSSTIAVSSTKAHSATKSLKTTSRTQWYSGPAQYIDGYVKPSQQYYVEAWVYLPLTGIANTMHISLYTKGTGSSQVDATTDQLVPALIWTKLSGNVTAPSWSGSLDYAFIKVSGAGSGDDSDFYLDDVIVRETTTGRFIYRQVLGPGVNPYGSVNAQGIYWINCAGNKLIIERSRIKGTLLVINPGANSCVGPGPINWSPAVPGYPALLVDADVATDADFAILATNRALSETENGVNYNPSGAPHDDFGQDTDTVDIYPSEIQGMIAVRDDLTFASPANGQVRGQIVVGDDIVGSSGSLEVLYRPYSLLSPPPGFSAASYGYSRRPYSIRKTVNP